MYEKYFKRLFDLVVSVFIFPIFILIYVFVGILIKIEDGGKILFKGQRLGKNLKIYNIYKFRSMKENAVDLRNEDGSTYNSEHDERVTKIGKILRKTSIDEIPQILNVVKGDMSFIGPRPSPTGNIDKYPKEYLEKFKVRPGITGYNQAYFRNNISIEEKQKNDLAYVKNISFRLDLKIILRTIKTVIKKENIYTNQ